MRFSDTVGVVIERTPTDYEDTIIYVSIGSNIEPESNIPKAIALLKRYATVLTTSSIYVTPPQAYTEQADFHNMAVKLLTKRKPVEFKTQVVDFIEAELGRIRNPNNKNAPRTIDLDISLWGNEILQYGDKPWQVPDKDIVRFAHVALPLAEIAPDYIHPTEQKTLQVLAEQFDKSKIRKIE